MASKSAHTHLLQGYLIEQTAKSMKLGFAHVLGENNIDVTVDQWIILDTLDQEDHLSQFDICNRTSKDAPTITRMLDILEKKSLLNRKVDASDRRKFLITLSPKGKKQINIIKPLSNAYRTQCYQGLKKSEMTILKNILNTISKNLEK